MKVDASQVFSLVNRLADIVAEEGITTALPGLVGDRFDALEIDVAKPEANVEQADAQAMRDAIGQHWAVVKDTMDANASPGPRKSAPVAAAREPENYEGVAEENQAASNQLRDIAAGVLDMETSTTARGRLFGLSYVRQGLDVLTRSGLMMLEGRYEAVASKMQGEAAQQAANALHALKNDTVEVGRKIHFSSNPDKLTFAELVGVLRDDLKGKNEIDVHPAELATGALRYLHRLDTLLNAVQASDGTVNGEIVKELASDLKSLADLTAQVPTQNAPPMLLDQLPKEMATAIRNAVEHLKVVYHFDAAFTKVPLPKPDVAAA